MEKRGGLNSLGNGGEGEGDGNDAGISGEETAIEPLSLFFSFFKDV